jgi:DMSO reductase anchor subunit
MSFREKSTWITFLLVLGVFGIFFFEAGLHLFGPSHQYHNDLMLFLALVIVIVVLEVVLHVIVAARSPKDANTPQDERERLIALKATRPAFYVLMVGAVLAVATVHLGRGPVLTLHAVLFAMWIAELTRNGVKLYYYRRDA